MSEVVSNSEIIEVQPFGGYDQALSYGVPKSLISRIQIGCLVRISLGRRNTIGIVLSLTPKERPPVNKLKFITSLVQEQPVLNEELIRLARWMCTYYASSIDHVLEGMIPSAVKEGMGEKKKRYIQATKDSKTELALAELKNSPQQKKLF